MQGKFCCGGWELPVRRVGEASNPGLGAGAGRVVARVTANVTAASRVRVVAENWSLCEAPKKRRRETTDNMDTNE